MIWLYAILSVFLVSLVSLVGVFTLSFSERQLKKVLLVLVAIAAGTLIGDAFLHLLPEYVKKFGFSTTTGLLILGGIVLLFIIERFVFWHHCHDPHLCDDPSDDSDHSGHMHPMGTTVLVGDGLHNFLDGALIASSYLVSVPVGIASTIAVMIHEIPQEIADYGVLLHSGYSKGKALIVNFLSGLIAVFGVGLVLVAQNIVHSIEKFLIPLTAGAFIYIAAADLMPELKHEKSTGKMILHFGAFLLGIILMFGLLFTQ